LLLLHGLPPEQEDAFADLLRYIAEQNGFLTPRQAERRLAGADLDDRGGEPVLLSFDDGFASNFTVARTLLAERRIKALFFVCPGLIDLDPEAQQTAVRQRLFPLPPSAPIERLMSWDEVAALHEDGHVIGAHTMTHARLAGLGPTQLADEIGASAERIATQIGSRPDWFAFPFGEIDAVNEAAIRVIGRHYAYCRSGVRGLNHAATHPLALHADHMDLAAAPAWRRLILAGGLDFYYRTARQRLGAMAAYAADTAKP
jgi:peptidoglycan/xylan/chitin deacetylase (PgdA/CDA1 family)